jgi:hypothetical protein
MFKEGRSPDRPRRLESRRSLVARSVSASHDVMAVDPDSLPVSHSPMSWFPDVIGAAYVITRTPNVVRSIANLDRDRTRITAIIGSATIRSSAIIRSVARVSAVSAFTPH